MSMEKTSRYKILLSKNALADIGETKNMRKIDRQKQGRRHSVSDKAPSVAIIFYHYLFTVAPAVCIKFRIADVEVLLIKSILQEPEGFTESLEMYNLALSQEADGIADFGIFDQAEDVIVCGAGFLFCCHILGEIGDQVPLTLELAGIEGNAACRLWLDAYGVIHIA